MNAAESIARRRRLLCATLFLVSAFLAAQTAPAKDSREAPFANTLLVDCNSGKNPIRVLSPVSLSEQGNWHAYVEVDVDSECLHTTRLWAAKANTPYRLLYLMPPMRDAVENGMQILGWARNSRLLLVRTEAWQQASDAGGREQVLAVDAGNGMVYDPDLEEMLQDKKQRQCGFFVNDAGFASDGNVDILVRAKFYTFIDDEETLEDIPPAKRCVPGIETWSFNFANGEIKQVPNTERLQLLNNLVPQAPSR